MRTAMPALSHFFRWCHWICPLLYLLTTEVFQPYMEVDTVQISAAHVMGEPSPHFMYVGYIDGYLLMYLRQLCPSIEWFWVLLHLLNLIAIAIFSYCVIRCKEGTPNWRNYVGLIVFLLFQVIMVRHMYYAYTACAATTAGFILLLHSVRHRSKTAMGIGCVVFILGASIRYDAIIPYCLTLGVLACVRKQWAILCVCVISAGFIGLQCQCQTLMANVKIWGEHTKDQNLVLLHQARMRFSDYPDAHDSEKSALYKAAGITDNDKVMISQGLIPLMPKCMQAGWLTEAARIRDIDNERIPHSIEAICQRLGGKDAANHLLQTFFLPYKGRLALLLFLLLFPLPCTWKDGRLWVGATAMASLLVLIVGGRYHALAVHSALIIPMALIVYETPVRSRANALLSRFPKTFFAALIAVILMSFGGMARNFSPFSALYQTKSHFALIVEECQRHPENQYLCNCHDWRAMLLPHCTYFSAPYVKLNNLTYIATWSNSLPSMQSVWRDRGLTLRNLPDFLVLTSYWNLDVTFLPELFQLYEEQYGVRLTLKEERALGGGLYVFRIVKAGQSA